MSAPKQGAEWSVWPVAARNEEHAARVVRHTKLVRARRAYQAAREAFVADEPFASARLVGAQALYIEALEAAMVAGDSFPWAEAAR